MILVINDDLELCDSITDMFRLHGIPCYGAKLDESTKEPANLYSLVLLPEPFSYCEIAKIIKTIKERFCSLPICKVGIPRLGDEKLFDTVIYPKGARGGVLSGIVNMVLSAFNIGKYNADNLRLPTDEKIAYLGSYKINLTKTEGLLLRCIMRSANTGAKKEDLLKYCYRRGSYTELSAIRTHICSINKKCEAICGQKLVCSEKQRYYISTSMREKSSG